MNLLRIIVASCLTLVGVSLAALTILTPASSGTTTPHRHHAPPAEPPPAEPLPGPPPAESLPVAGLDVILAAIGCERPAVQVEAAELHEVSCRLAAGRYTVMTFTTRAGEDAWLGEAESYGGTYLVGDGWAVVAASNLLSGLLPRLGGRIEGRIEDHRH
ncbi:hypothetical protein [Nonomuraea insulae]|uniref:Lipoprotein n=1 Tax=Nonomuraea insulae TaxID=1616787 RepID=A0ABW1CQ40_9ACTN